MEPMIKHKLKNIRKPHDTSIFIVDDDISYMYPLVFYLQRKTGYKIYCFTTGEECVNNINLEPGVVILDYNLNPQPPNSMNGLDVLRRIKKMSPRSKVVVLSSRDTYQAVENSLKTGAYTYVLKDTAAITNIKNIIYTLCNNGNGKDLMTDTT